jgi:hypothetical protein
VTTRPQEAALAPSAARCVTDGCSPTYRIGQGAMDAFPDLFRDLLTRTASAACFTAIGGE